MMFKNILPTAAFAALFFLASSGVLAQESQSDSVRLDPAQWQRSVTADPDSAEQSQTISEDLTVDLSDVVSGDPLSLSEATRIGLAQSLDIRIYRLDQEIQTQTLGQAKAVYDTYLSVTGDYEIDETEPASAIFGDRSVDGSITTSFSKHLPTGTDITFSHVAARSSTSSPFATQSRLYSGSGALSVSQPMLKNFLGRIDRARLNQVRLNIESFDYETLDRIEAKLFGIREAYWDLVFAQLNLSSRRDALTKAQEFLQSMRDKLELGLVEKQDVYAAEANVRLRVVEVLEAKTAFLNRQYSLQVLLDMPEDVLPVPSSVPEIKPIERSLEAILDEAFANRRDLKQLKLQAQMDDLQLVMTGSARWPDLDLEASYRSNSLDRELWDSQGEIGSFNHPTLYAGFSFVFPLENRSARAEHRQAKLRQRGTLLAIKQVQNQIGEEIRQAFRDTRLAEARVRQTAKIETLQSNKLAEESRFFQLGRSDSQKIIDYQEDLIAAQTNAQEAIVRYEKAYDALLRRSNRLLVFIENNSAPARQTPASQ